MMGQVAAWPSGMLPFFIFYYCLKDDVEVNLKKWYLIAHLKQEVIQLLKQKCAKRHPYTMFLDAHGGKMHPYKQVVCNVKKPNMDKEAIKILEQINTSLAKMNVRDETKEMMSDTYKLLDKSDRRVENSLNQIQNTFDRIHDKVFNFNNVMIGAFLVLGTFPDNTPHLKLWTIMFPIINMVFMIYIDYRQMEIHRYAAGEQDWNEVERTEYGNKISRQTKLSLFSLFLSVLCLFYLIIEVM